MHSFYVCSVFLPPNCHSHKGPRLLLNCLSDLATTVIFSWFDNTSLEYFTGDRSSTDWDKAWSSFRKQGKKSLFSQFNPNKYVSWNPRRSDYPLSEEVDPIKRTERSNLMLWTSPRFTLFGAIIVVSLLLIYTLLAPMK
ncbi:hypothetical protein Scep_004680 [Stephania cephalantha]|uniref:Uncharacterized protein n=1 Tax=Stephania cephalantha TaxID=152367 RepID=A0AAP0KSW5_9MAGN